MGSSLHCLVCRSDLERPSYDQRYGEYFKTDLWFPGGCCRSTRCSCYPSISRVLTLFLKVGLFLRWSPVAAGIDNEYRSFEKFTAFSGRGLLSSWSGRRIVATPSFLLYSHKTIFKAVCQAGNSNLTGIVVAANNVSDTRSLDSNDVGNGGLGTQVMVTVRIIDLTSGTCIFAFR